MKINELEQVICDTKEMLGIQKGKDRYTANDNIHIQGQIDALKGLILYIEAREIRDEPSRQ